MGRNPAKAPSAKAGVRRRGHRTSRRARFRQGRKAAGTYKAEKPILPASVRRERRRRERHKRGLAVAIDKIFALRAYRPQKPRRDRTLGHISAVMKVKWLRRAAARLLCTALVPRKFYQGIASSSMLKNPVLSAWGWRWCPAFRSMNTYRPGEFDDRRSRCRRRSERRVTIASTGRCVAVECEPPSKPCRPS